MTSERSFKHGYDQKSAAYRAWKGARQRCYDARCKDYRRYGARGIEVAARWDDFRDFLADMGEPPPGMTLERVDNAGPYAPGNCRWATRREQAQNRG